MAHYRLMGAETCTARGLLSVHDMDEAHRRIYVMNSRSCSAHFIPSVLIVSVLAPPPLCQRHSTAWAPLWDGFDRCVYFFAFPSQLPAPLDRLGCYFELSFYSCCVRLPFTPVINWLYASITITVVREAEQQSDRFWAKIKHYEKSGKDER